LPLAQTSPKSSALQVPKEPAVSVRVQTCDAQSGAERHAPITEIRHFPVLGEHRCVEHCELLAQSSPTAATVHLFCVQRDVEQSPSTRQSSPSDASEQTLLLHFSEERWASRLQVAPMAWAVHAPCAQRDERQSEAAKHVPPKALAAQAPLLHVCEEHWAFFSHEAPTAETVHSPCVQRDETQSGSEMHTPPVGESAQMPPRQFAEVQSRGIWQVPPTAACSQRPADAPVVEHRPVEQSGAVRHRPSKKFDCRHVPLSQRCVVQPASVAQGPSTPAGAHRLSAPHDTERQSVDARHLSPTWAILQVPVVVSQSPLGQSAPTPQRPPVELTAHVLSCAQAPNEQSDPRLHGCPPAAVAQVDDVESHTPDVQPPLLSHGPPTRAWTQWLSEHRPLRHPSPVSMARRSRPLRTDLRRMSH
jgi:hypothetical protein